MDKDIDYINVFTMEGINREELKEITAKYAYMVIPTEYVCVYHKLLVYMADFGKALIADCSAACKGSSKTVVDCWNMFQSAVACYNLDRKKEAETYIKYIEAQLKLIYKGTGKQVYDDRFVVPLDEKGHISAIVSCGNETKFYVDEETGKLIESSKGEHAQEFTLIDEGLASRRVKCFNVDEPGCVREISLEDNPVYDNEIDFVQPIPLFIPVGITVVNLENNYVWNNVVNIRGTYHNRKTDTNTVFNLAGNGQYLDTVQGYKDIYNLTCEILDKSYEFVEWKYCVFNKDRVNSGIDMVNLIKSDGIRLGSNTSYSFNITEFNKEFPNRCYYIGAVIRKRVVPCIVTASANYADGYNITGVGTYNEGDRVTIVVTAKEGYVFNNMDINGQLQTSNNTYSFVITDDTHITINLTKKDTYVGILIAADSAKYNLKVNNAAQQTDYKLDAFKYQSTTITATYESIEGDIIPKGWYKLTTNAESISDMNITDDILANAEVINNTTLNVTTPQYTNYKYLVYIPKYESFKQVLQEVIIAPMEEGITSAETGHIRYKINDEEWVDNVETIYNQHLPFNAKLTVEFVPNEGYEYVRTDYISSINTTETTFSNTNPFVITNDNTNPDILGFVYYIKTRKIVPKVSVSVKYNIDKLIDRRERPSNSLRFNGSYVYDNNTVTKAITIGDKIRIRYSKSIGIELQEPDFKGCEFKIVDEFNQPNGYIEYEITIKAPVTFEIKSVEYPILTYTYIPSKEDQPIMTDRYREIAMSQNANGTRSLKWSYDKDAITTIYATYINNSRPSKITVSNIENITYKGGTGIEDATEYTVKMVRDTLIEHIEYES